MLSWLLYKCGVQYSASGGIYGYNLNWCPKLQCSSTTSLPFRRRTRYEEEMREMASLDKERVCVDVRERERGEN